MDTCKQRRCKMGYPIVGGGNMRYMAGSHTASLRRSQNVVIIIMRRMCSVRITMQLLRWRSSPHRYVESGRAVPVSLSHRMPALSIFCGSMWRCNTPSTALTKARNRIAGLSPRAERGLGRQRSAPQSHTRHRCHAYLLRYNYTTAIVGIMEVNCHTLLLRHRPKAKRMGVASR